MQNRNFTLNFPQRKPKIVKTINIHSKALFICHASSNQSLYITFKVKQFDVVKLQPL